MPDNNLKFRDHKQINAHFITVNIRNDILLIINISLDVLYFNRNSILIIIISYLKVLPFNSGLVAGHNIENI